MSAVYSIRAVDGFRFVHREEVPFRDLDGIGHVNNAVYLTYLEQARIDVPARGARRRSLDLLVIVADVEIDFRSPPRSARRSRSASRVAASARRASSSSTRSRPDGRLVAEAKSVLVGFDYERRDDAVPTTGASSSLRGGASRRMSERLRAPHARRTACASLTAPHAAGASRSPCFVMLAAGSRYETARDERHRALRRAHVLQGHRAAPDARATSPARSTRSAASSTPSPARSTPATTSSARREHRDVALDVLVDMLRHSKFDAEEIEREKGVIVEEMNMYLDTPRDYIDGVYDELLYGDQPLGWDIIGTQGDGPRARRARRSSTTSTAGTAPPRMVVGLGGASATTLLPTARGAARRRPDGGDRRARRRSQLDARTAPRVRVHTKAVRPGALCARRPQLPARPPRPLRARSCSRRCSAAACRRASSPRCASGAASPTTSTAQPRATPTRARCSRRPASTSTASTRRCKTIVAEFARIARRAGPGRRAREGAQRSRRAASCSARGSRGD